MDTTQAFFDDLSRDYDPFIRRVVARYDEMLWAMFYYLPEGFSPRHILELGCGTGILTQKIHQTWPEAAVTAVDLSAEMIAQSRRRVAETAAITFRQEAFETLSLPQRTYDLVMSNMAIHHLRDPEKQALLGNIVSWLCPGGFFVLSDQVQGGNARLSELDFALCLDRAREKGSPPAEVADLIHHMTQHDHPATVSTLLTLFQTAGFVETELLWRYGMWLVMQAQAPPAPL